MRRRGGGGGGGRITRYLCRLKVEFTTLLFQPLHCQWHEIISDYSISFTMEVRHNRANTRLRERRGDMNDGRYLSPESGMRTFAEVEISR